MRFRMLGAMTSMLLQASGALAGEAIPDETNLESIKSFIAQLEDEQFEKREAAVRALCRAGQPALEPLKQMLSGRKERSPGFLINARRLVELLDLGGQAVDGLKIRLAADKTAVAPGGEIEFAITLCNLTEKAKILRPFYLPGVNYFECGWTFDIKGEEKGVATEFKKAITITRIIEEVNKDSEFVNLPAFSVLRYQARGRFGVAAREGPGVGFENPQNRQYASYVIGPPGKSHSTFQGPLNRIQRFSVWLAGNPDLAPEDESRERFWRGWAESNKIEIHLDLAIEKNP